MTSFLSSFFGLGAAVEEPTARAEAPTGSHVGMKQRGRNSMHKEGWEGTFDPGTNSHTKSLGSSKFDSGSNSVWEVIESANPAPFLGAAEKVPLRRASVDSGSPGAHATIVQPACGASVPAGLKQEGKKAEPDGYMRNKNMRNLGSSKFDGGDSSATVWDEINRSTDMKSTAYNDISVA